MVAPSPEDEWITDESGRRRRVRAAAFTVKGAARASTNAGATFSVDSDAALRVASSAEAFSQRANVAADELTAASLEEDVPVADADAIGWELVRQHNSEFACWIVVGGRVLDATAYLGHHPGGSAVIQRLAGRDATRAYEKAHHSRAADLKLHDFVIGGLGDIRKLRRAAKDALHHSQRLESAAKYLTVS